MMICLFRLSLISLVSIVITQDPLTIKTNSGNVRGKTETGRNGKEVDSWYSIPYAKPPINELRFRYPVPIDSWEDTKITTELPSSCYQMELTNSDWNPNTSMSENCLYLSIIVPKPRPSNASVMIWIYGGGFMHGTSTLDGYNYETLASEENIIVAAMQYRIGALGFLYFGTKEAPGNVGLFDQRLAIQWIHENIEFFGGNKNDITIFGMSAGGASVGMHLLSSDSRKYFTGAILQSGVPMNPWATYTKDKLLGSSLLLGKKLNCASHYNISTEECERCDQGNHVVNYNSKFSELSFAEIVDCLRKRDIDDIIFSQAVSNLHIIEFNFVPFIDGVFFEEDFINILNSTDFSNHSLMVGSMSSEATLFLQYAGLSPLFENETFSEKQFEELVDKMYYDSSEDIQAVIRTEYTPWLNRKDGKMNRKALINMISDQYFICSGNEFIDYFVKSSKNAYMYYLTHRSSQSPHKIWVGATHGEDIKDVFGEPLDISENAKDYREEEKEFSKRVMKYWANFARTGNPSVNIDGTETSIPWPRYTEEEKEYLILDTVKNSIGNDTDTAADTAAVNVIGNGLRVKECALWNYLIPKLEALKMKQPDCP